VRKLLEFMNWEEFRKGVRSPVEALTNGRARLRTRDHGSTGLMTDMKQVLMLPVSSITQIFPKLGARSVA